MRCALWLLIVTTGTANAQWRHFGEGLPANTPSVFSRDIVAAHNAVRRHAGVPTLVWSGRLASVAQDWANILIARRQFFHRPNGNYGENLFEITGATISSTEVVREWASESRSYDYSSNQCRGVCGHYTQIVWRDTKEVGCGIARGNGREVWVCNYDPPGNWAGRRPY